MKSDLTPVEKQLRGYRLATAEIIYRLPDHPKILQSFVWQHLDIAPDYPELMRFLSFWNKEIEGPIYEVKVGRKSILGPNEIARADHLLTLH